MDVQPHGVPQSGNVLGHAWGIAGSMHVSQIVPQDQKVVTIPFTCRACEAFETMRENGFDQLPVEAQDRSIIGIFSYRSFATHLSKYKVNSDPLSRVVIDMSEDPNFCRPSESISAVVETLNANGSIVVGNEHDVYSLITVYDLLHFIWVITQPFMLIGEIETTLRIMMSDSRSAEEIQEAICRSFSSGNSRACTSLEQLSFGELLSVLQNGANFGQYYKSIFNDRNLVSQTLGPVLPIRNTMFHFRGQLSDDDLEKLKAAHGWLNRKWKATRVTAQE